MKNVSSKVNNEQYFNTDHLKSDLKGRSVRYGAVTIIARKVSPDCRWIQA